MTALCLLPALLCAQDKPECKFIESPHFEKGSNRTIRYVVLHTVEGSLQGCVSWFRNPKSQVSAHFVVGFSGEIVQMVREEDIAWHAGNRRYNQESIGIEHEGFADKNQWTMAQYRASAAITRYICKKYKIPIDRDHIISHQSITPQRRRDPGPHFDWDLYLALVKGEDGKSEAPKAKKKQDDPIAQWWKNAEEAEARKEYWTALEHFRRIAYDADHPTYTPRALKKLEEYKTNEVIARAIRDREVEAECKAWLSSAQTWYGGGLLTDARGMFLRIVETHPATAWAAEARKKIAEIDEKIRQAGK